VGLFVLKLLLANGIKNIVATAGSMSRIEKLHQLGLPKDSIINYRKENLTEIIKRRSNQQGINVAIDAVGQHLSEVAAAVLKPYGTYIDITHFTTAAARDQLFSSAAQIINIQLYPRAKTKLSLFQKWAESDQTQY